MSSRRGEPKKKINGLPTRVVLRLYVAGNAPNSARAVANIEEICREHLTGAHDLEIIDVLEYPERAMAAGILVTPTLAKLHPQPTAQIVGNLSDKPRVLLAIGVRSDQRE